MAELNCKFTLGPENHGHIGQFGNKQPVVQSTGPFFDPFFFSVSFLPFPFFLPARFFAKGVLIVFGIALSIPSAPLPFSLLLFFPSPHSLCCVTTRTQSSKREREARAIDCE